MLITAIVAYLFPIFTVDRQYEAIRTVPTTAFTTIPTPKVISGGKNKVARVGVGVIIVGVLWVVGVVSGVIANIHLGSGLNTVV